MCAAADARHQRVRVNLANVTRLLEAVAGDGPPAPELVAQFEDLAAFLERHCTREEQILWPALEALADAARQGQPRPPLPFPTMLHPVRLMEGEHAGLRERLDRLRQVTQRSASSDVGGERWRNVCEGLAALDAAVVDHVRFENEVLFPLALVVESELT
ncbi:MAG: hemerythrin domain-containing protein [Acidobacteriota bacterium]|nr:hemerythrin domain-containing protein [Acidobacteriota bacterium]